MKNIPDKERALILQGGGSLGAYEAGAFSTINSFIKFRDGEQKNTDRQIFDIVAGTSIGAINAAILVSHVMENKTWDGSSEKLLEFWNYISTESLSDKFSEFMEEWWNYWRQFFKDAATAEAARRYYSATEFTIHGAPKVFSSPHTVPDTKFFNMMNNWYRYSNQSLKESLERFAKFPIATSHEDNQPRLILTAVDVMGGVPVVFDSYVKEDGTRKTEYGRYLMNKDTNHSDDRNDDVGIGFEHIIRYPDGITSDHVVASAAVPVSFDYVPLEAESYNSKTKKYEQNVRYFWDGGLLANTPLAQVVISHRRFWYQIKGVKDRVPKLGVVLINLHPTRVDKVPWDLDGVINRNIDIIFADKSERDQTIILLISDLVDLSKKLINIAKSNGVEQTVIDELLDDYPASHGKLSLLKPGRYRNLVEGQFNIDEVIRIERKHTEHETSKKLFDFSSNTIKRLLQDGHDDVVELINTRFGHQYAKIFELKKGDLMDYNLERKQ